MLGNHQTRVPVPENWFADQDLRDPDPLAENGSLGQSSWAIRWNSVRGTRRGVDAHSATPSCFELLGCDSSPTLSPTLVSSPSVILVGSIHASGKGCCLRWLPKRGMSLQGFYLGGDPENTWRGGESQGEGNSIKCVTGQVPTLGSWDPIQLGSPEIIQNTHLSYPHCGKGLLPIEHWSGSSDMLAWPAGSVHTRGWP